MIKYIYSSLLLIFLFSCSESVSIDNETDRLPSIFPDYTDITIPPNIAPLHFSLKEKGEKAIAIFTSGNESFQVNTSKGNFNIPESKWKKLLQTSSGENISVKIAVYSEGNWTGYAPFHMQVAAEPIDSYIAYRLIEPGYEVWAQMGIYQRNLEGFKESAIMENKMSGDNCMNCHSFRMQQPDNMLFHMRGENGGTLLIDGDKIEKLNTKTDQTISTLVYPYWHPEGRYIAFSVNDTKQGFHMNDPNRVEVFDHKSDVVVYDTQTHEIFTSPVLFSPEAFETFPTFSPDGKTLYFCSAEKQSMPDEFEKVKYSLCSVSFDAQNRKFGSTVDTLYNASTHGKSVSFPRISPDGKHLLYTLSGYGNFSIWHKDADLYMINLQTGEHFPLEKANSNDVESYHSWSSNSRWIVFSSRRIDGLYTRPYFAYINPDGKAEKPFLLPQKDTEFYHRFMKSYNIPEFITGKVKEQRKKIGMTAKKEKGTDVKFAGSL